uniref:Uncharacterized protein n=1 Tax=Fagus sylvatica TaxID=28930 RepID=A0A2N9EL14_FAGSY
MPEHGHKHSDQDQDPEPYERRSKSGSVMMDLNRCGHRSDHDDQDPEPIMSVVEVGVSMIIWMSRTTMTIMTNIMTVVMTNMIEWRMMITNMSVQHQSHVKGREQEMWSMSIDDRRGHFLGSTSTKAASTS